MTTNIPVCHMKLGSYIFLVGFINIWAKYTNKTGYSKVTG